MFDKVITRQQIRDVDRLTCQAQKIDSLQLMERVADRLTSQLIALPAFRRYIVFAGFGNNGGDALVVARKLTELGKKVLVFLLPGEYSDANLANQSRVVYQVIGENTIDWQEVGQDGDLLLDGIFGSGLSRSIVANSLTARVITGINACPAFKVAIDISSGLTADPTQDFRDLIAVQADLTLCLQIPKSSLLMPEFVAWTGVIKFLNIGLDRQAIESQESYKYLLDFASLQTLFRYYFKNNEQLSRHKGDFGKLLILAGKHDQTGCAFLASKAALRTGCGLLYCHVLKSVLDRMQICLPEAVCSIAKGSEYMEDIPDIVQQVNALVIGPGIGIHNFALVEQSLALKKAMVLDADALSVLAHSPKLLKLLPHNAILTPHPKEFARLTGTSFTSRNQSIEFQRQLSQKHSIIIVLKGRFTVISDPQGNLYFNPTGNYGMASAGSGDVLAGMIGSLLSQKLSPLNACLMGVFLHGLAGDIAAENQHPKSLIASDIIEQIGAAFNRILGEETLAQRKVVSL